MSRCPFKEDIHFRLCNVIIFLWITTLKEWHYWTDVRNVTSISFDPHIRWSVNSTPIWLMENLLSCWIKISWTLTQTRTLVLQFKADKVESWFILDLFRIWPLRSRYLHVCLSLSINGPCLIDFISRFKEPCKIFML